MEAVVLAGVCSERDEETWDVLSGGEKLSEFTEADGVSEDSGTQEFSKEHKLLKYWPSKTLILWGITEESGGNSFRFRLAIVSMPFETRRIKVKKKR